MSRCHLIQHMFDFGPGSRLTVLALAATLASQGMATEATVQSPRVFEFRPPGILFDASFEGAALSDCVQLGENEYRAIIRAEDRPINNSPWYAFRITSEVPRSITVHLDYEGGSHRYPPKVSDDGIHWKRLATGSYSTSEGSASLQLDVAPKPLWVAAQEMIGLHEIDAWLDTLKTLPSAERGVVGQSIAGRPIWKLEFGEGRRGCVLIIGRQHPPEVTGTIALMGFVEELAGTSDLAQQFRRDFQVVVVPLVNPDGVAAGHWRHNLGGVDLNRDWGPFRQPETRAVRDEILKYRQEGNPPLALLLDFHSTHRDLFYVQRNDQPTRPPGFTRHWLNSLSKRLPDYTVRIVAMEGEKPTSSRWGYQTFGVPAVTCEYGDNTDRSLIRKVTRIAAEELMTLLLKSEDRNSKSQTNSRHEAPTSQTF